MYTKIITKFDFISMSKNMMIAVVALILIVGGFMYMDSARRAEKNAMMTSDESMVLDDGTADDSDTTLVEETGDSAADDSDSIVKDDGSMGQDGILTVTLAEVTDSATKQTGTATLVEKNGKVVVTVKVTPVQSGPQPAHIHVGSCPGVGAVAYPLTNLVNGTSTTMLDVTMADLKAKKPLAINIHKSADESKVYTACGSL